MLFLLKIWKDLRALEVPPPDLLASSGSQEWDAGKRQNNFMNMLCMINLITK